MGVPEKLSHNKWKKQKQLTSNIGNIIIIVNM
jgi:hypothetical protein